MSENAYHLEGSEVHTSLRAALQDFKKLFNGCAVWPAYFANKYKELIIANPDFGGHIEGIFRTVSYLLAGRFDESPVLSELAYSAGNLLRLVHDIIIKKALNLTDTAYNNVSVEKIKQWLTVIDYLEVFVELAVHKRWGSIARWLLVFSVNLLKACLRLILYLKCKRMLSVPPLEPIDRQKQEKVEMTKCVGLKRSGRTFRTISGAPPLHARQWHLPMHEAGSEDEVMLENSACSKKSLMISECLHISRPIIHLTSMVLCGQKSWKPWLIAAAVDLSSLHVLKKVRGLTASERQELQRRSWMMLYYLLRSPLYDTVTRARLLAMLGFFVKHFPGASIIISPLIEYLPVWQQTYFYIWAS